MDLAVNCKKIFDCFKEKVFIDTTDVLTKDCDSAKQFTQQETFYHPF